MIHLTKYTSFHYPLLKQIDFHFHLVYANYLSEDNT